MSRLEAPPFERGTTAYAGDTTGTSDQIANALGGEWEFDDLDWTTNVGVRPKRSNGKVLCRLVRNTGTAALKPKHLASFAATAGTYGQTCDGMTDVEAERGFPVDEWLPSTGIPANDVGWIVMRGVSKVVSPGSNMAVDIAVGDPLVAITAAASTGGTLAGRATVQNVNQATTLLANQVRNYIGTAMSACLTNSTSADILAFIGRW